MLIHKKLKTQGATMKTTLATILVIGTLLLGCTTGTTPSVVTSATTYTPADPTKGAIAFNLPLIGSGTKSIKTDAQALVQGYDIYVYSSTDDEPVVNTTTGGEVYVDYLVADTYSAVVVPYTYYANEPTIKSVVGFGKASVVVSAGNTGQANITLSPMLLSWNVGTLGTTTAFKPNQMNNFTETIGTQITLPSAELSVGAWGVVTGTTSNGTAAFIATGTALSYQFRSIVAGPYSATSTDTITFARHTTALGAITLTDSVNGKTHSIGYLPIVPESKVVPINKFGVMPTLMGPLIISVSW